MSIRVPTTEQIVSPQSPTVQPVQVPGAVPGAFGEEVARATAGLGQDIAGIGKKIGDVAIYQANQEAEIRDAKLKTQYIQGWQDRLYSQELEAIKDPITGKDRQRPRGYLARIGEQVDSNMPTSMIQDNADFLKTILDQEPNPRRKALLKIQLDNHFSAIRENGIQHTVNETRKAAENTFKQTSLNYINSATLSNTPELLKNSIANIMLNNKAWENRVGKGVAWLIHQNHDDIGDVLWKATDSVLESTGDVERAKALLNDSSLKDLIPEDLYEATEVKLDDRGDRIKKQIARQDALDEFKQTSEIIKGIASGTIDLNNPNIDVVKLAGKNTKLGIAIKAVQADKGSYTPEKIENEAFQNYVKDVYAADSKETISNLLVDALNATGNKEISQDRLNILVDAAMNHAENLPIKKGDEPTVSSPKQNEIVAGVKAIINNVNKNFSIGNMLDNFFKAIQGGKSPTEAHSEAIKSEINRTNSLSVKYKIGDIITNHKGESAEVIGFNDTGAPLLRKRISGKPSSNTK